MRKKSTMGSQIWEAFMSIFSWQSKKVLQPAPVLVQFVDSDVKDSLFNQYLRSLSTGFPVTTSIFGDAVGTRIYIEHQLSPDLVKIKKKAAEFKKKGYFQKIKTSYDTIEVQKNNKWHTIDSVEELTRFVQ